MSEEEEKAKVGDWLDRVFAKAKHDIQFLQENDKYLQSVRTEFGFDAMFIMLMIIDFKKTDAVDQPFAAINKAIDIALALRRFEEDWNLQLIYKKKHDATQVARDRRSAETTKAIEPLINKWLELVNAGTDSWKACEVVAAEFDGSRSAYTVRRVALRKGLWPQK